MSKSLQAENALNSWRQWDAGLSRRPVILKPLGGGRSNRSFLLDSDGKRMVLRMNGLDLLLPNASREHEYAIWRVASEQGIAPPVLYVNEQKGVLVSTYINNSLPPQPPPGQGIATQAFDLLRRCHQLEVEAPTIDYASHIERYWNNIKDRDMSVNPALVKQREPMRLLLETLINSGTETGLCHHDPVVANFVGNADRLYLIDWEYAARGLLLMDYAAMAVEWEIDDTTVFERTGIAPELLIMAKTLYRYICDLWEAQNGPRAWPGVTVLFEIQKASELL